MKGWPFGYGRCHCGCGLKTNLAERTQGRLGLVKGQPRRYRKGHHFAKGRRRPKETGYMTVYLPDHPRAHGNGYVLEHLLVAEKALGRPIPPEHPVHHHNGDGMDNTPGNLVLCQDQAYHMLLHQRMRALKACGNPGWLHCSLCGEYGPPETMYLYKGNSQGHPRCQQARRRARRNAA
jgi:hypothetical protein